VHVVVMGIGMNEGEALTYVFKPPLPEDRAGFIAAPSDLLADTRYNVRS
jgi:hypothetical protein